MKNIFKTVISLVACSAFAMSCGGDKVDPGKWAPEAKGDGELSMSLTKDNSYSVIYKSDAPEAISKTLSKADPSVADFHVKIKDKNGAIIKQYESFSDIESVITIPSGEYKIEAANGDQQLAAFEAPYYYGSKDFTINIQELTSVDMVCRLANVKATVQYTEKFVAEVENIEVLVTNGYDAALVYTPTEVRSGFFAVPADGRLQVTVTGLRKSDGKPLTETQYIGNVEARQWHKITINIATNGTTAVGIVIDTELIDKDVEIIVPGGDDIIDNGGDEGDWNDPDPKPDPDPNPDPDPVGMPTVTGASYNGNPFDIEETINVSKTCQVLDVAIAAPEQIEQLKVTILSPNLGEALLSGMGLWGEFDMATPNATQSEALTELGLIDPASPIKGKTAHTFSVGTFMGLLALDNSAIGQNHKFKITVVDKKGNSLTRTLSLILTE